MRVLVVLLALVATPLVTGVSQDRTQSPRHDNDLVRHSNERGGDVDRDRDGEKCDKTHPAARGGSARSFEVPQDALHRQDADRKSTRLNSSHSQISYAVFCLKKKKKKKKESSMHVKQIQ